jgi:hypothetical protein
MSYEGFTISDLKKMVLVVEDGLSDFNNSFYSESKCFKSHRL